MNSRNNRRDFFKTVAGATAGMYVMGGGRAAAQGAPPGQHRRETGARRRRARTLRRAAGDSVKGTQFEKQGVGDMKDLEERIPLMDKQGVDIQGLSINGFWWYEVKDRGWHGRSAPSRTRGSPSG